ncbi:MAG: porin [Burkholderiaceae bacterium]|nr:porin [Burkholderiaceae bacterium]
MKNSLIALAVLGLSGAALAQSSAATQEDTRAARFPGGGLAIPEPTVTLYGRADASLIKLQGQNARMGSGTPDVMTNGDSRVGFMGNEDLGGGLKAGFQFETRINLSNGKPIVKNVAGGMWSPNASVWVGSADWGTLTMGSTYNPSFWGVFAWEITGAANYSVINKSYFWGGNNPRNDGMFSYKTPKFSGFTAQVAYITKTDMEQFIGGGANKAKWDANVIYNSGPLVASVIVNKSGLGSYVPMNGNKTNWAIGGKYDFGAFKVAASYTNSYANIANSSGLKGSQIYARRNGVTLGGSIPLGAFTLTADLGRDTKLQDKNGNSLSKRTNLVLEGKYHLSKRTFIYLAGLHVDGTNNYGLGIQHQF